MKIRYYASLLTLCISTLCYAQQMPIDFDDSADVFLPFGNSSFSANVDPQNNSNNVGQFHNDGSDPSQGFYIDLSQSIDLSTNKNITLSFYSFDPNAHSILLKLENGDNPNVEVRQSFSVPSPSDWKEITFDFSNAQLSSDGTPINATGTYTRLTLFIDEGVSTPGTYLIDNINDGSTPTDPNELDVIYSDLVWSDEFDTDGALDNTKWFHQTQLPAGGSWFNGELQHYTDRIENSFVDAGFLNIVAIKESFTDQGHTKEYTSARLNSKFAFTYGRVDVRAKLPFGNGTWPAIWTLGKNISETGAYWETQGFGTTSWPACGEIDIMEHGLHSVNEVSVALHTPSSSGATVNTATQMLADVANDYHVYSMNWSPDQITFLIDGVGFYTYRPSSQNSATWPFDEDQYLLLNIAMGGFSGTPDPSFTESSMVIDYVRVYQNVNLSTEDVFANKFSVYPNPTSDILNIRTDENIDRIALFNILGQTVLRQRVPGKQLHLHSMKSGIYVLKIYSGNKTVTKKVIIK
ncbi:family 16 glycosylhydrolase [Flavobacteriaceae bacterium S356]|uniref:Family 16 glycosylhydrolase n=1 Tax=Asprobacillus argus TaxID=3076534 RepID=A0ABU3LGX1_9FLAO|nr:family 16 glycosylhydrolase [Flavobacteriaceae bacterium S356]